MFYGCYFYQKPAGKKQKNQAVYTAINLDGRQDVMKPLLKF